MWIGALTGVLMLLPSGSPAPPGPPPSSDSVWTCVDAGGGTIQCRWERASSAEPHRTDANDESGHTSETNEPYDPAKDCYWAFVEDVYGPPSNPHPNADEASRIQLGDTVYLLYVKVCANGSREPRWLAEPPPGVAPLPTPDQLLPGARYELETTLPKPEWHTPAETDPNQWAYVNTPTYFWLDDGIWAEQVAEASFGPVWVRLSAVPVKLVIDPGEPDAQILECPFEPPEYVRGTPTESFLGCSYRYRHSSAVAANGQSFPVTVTMVWHATWQGSGGTGGDLGEKVTSVEPRLLPVAEVQAIVTYGD